MSDDHVLYDVRAPKRATNLSVNSDLLRRAKQHGINLSGLLERELVAELRRLESDRWVAENKEAIDAYNRRVAERGVFADKLRRF